MSSSSLCSSTSLKTFFLNTKLTGDPIPIHHPVPHPIFLVRLANPLLSAAAANTVTLSFGWIQLSLNLSLSSLPLTQTSLLGLSSQKGLGFLGLHQSKSATFKRGIERGSAEVAFCSREKSKQKQIDRDRKTKKEMLYIIGLGLGDEKDITLKGLEAVKKCRKVYMEAYTSLLSFGLSSVGLSTLEKLYGKPIIVADRETVEEKADDILSEAQNSDVAFLVVGDPFGATTHTDLVVRAKKLGLGVKVVHNASVMNAIGVCGLQLYRYGETVSLPFFTETWRPDSFYEKIKRNRTLGLHTLCLLDIRVKEPTLESLCRGRKQYEPPRYMTIQTAIEQLLEVEQKLGESVYDENTICVGLARLGSEDQKIAAGTMKQLLDVDFGAPLHCLVIAGETHPVEEEMLSFYTLGEEEPITSAKV